MRIARIIGIFLILYYFVYGFLIWKLAQYFDPREEGWVLQIVFILGPVLILGGLLFLTKFIERKVFKDKQIDKK